MIFQKVYYKSIFCQLKADNKESFFWICKQKNSKAFSITKMSHFLLYLKSIKQGRVSIISKNGVFYKKLILEVWVFFHNGQEEGEVAGHIWSRLGVLLQRGNAMMMANRIPSFPAPPTDGRVLVCTSSHLL